MVLTFDVTRAASSLNNVMVGKEKQEAARSTLSATRKLRIFRRRKLPQNLQDEPQIDQEDTRPRLVTFLIVVCAQQGKLRNLTLRSLALSLLASANQSKPNYTLPRNTLSPSLSNLLPPPSLPFFPILLPSILDSPFTRSDPTRHLHRSTQQADHVGKG